MRKLPRYIFYTACLALWASCGSSGKKSVDTPSTSQQTAIDLKKVQKEDSTSYAQNYKEFSISCKNVLDRDEGVLEQIRKDIANGKRANTTDLAKNIKDLAHRMGILRKRIDEFSEEGKEKTSAFTLDVQTELNLIEKALHP
jgi:hypothetical protein